MTAPAPPLTRVHWHHPEWPALTLSAACWLGLLVAVPADPTLLLRGSHPGGGPSTVAHVVVMTVAMMAPLVLTAAHDLAVGSLWRRRYRSVVLYLVGYLGSWVLVATMMVLGVHWARSVLGPLGVVAVTAAGAAVVARTHDHVVRLRRCGAGRPLALTGWAADRDCLDAGVRMSGRCVATSWALMLVLVAQGGLFVMVAGTALLLAERRGLISDRRLVHWTVAVGVLGALATASGVGGSVPPGFGPIDPHAGH